MLFALEFACYGNFFVEISCYIPDLGPGTSPPVSVPYIAIKMEMQHHQIQMRL